LSDGCVRAFVAFELPAAQRARLEAELGELRPELPPSRWTRPEGWHLTLKFLGEVERAALARLAGALRQNLGGHPAPTARLGGSGFFPSPANPRVAWVGGAVAGVEPVIEVLEEAAEAAGFARERRPWSVHLTVARLKARWPRSAVERFLGWGGALELEAFACTDVVLFESALVPGGAVYTALERIPLP
jgi:2'-5' RNA ligase